MSAKTAIVIGGGPAGALSALVLKKHGITPTVYEKRTWETSPDDRHPFWDVGGSIDLYGNGLRALERLGFIDDVLVNGGGSCSKLFFFLMDGSDGMAQNLVVDKPGEYRPIQILRSSYHKILMKNCEKQGIQIHTKKQVVDVQQTATNVTATFADGTSATADFLIAADGIYSSVRRILFPDHKPVQRHGVGFVGVFDLGVAPAEGVPLLGFEHGEMAIYSAPVAGNLIYTVHCPEDNAGAWVLMQCKKPAEGEDPDWLPYQDLPRESTRLANIVEEWGAPASVTNAVRFSKRITPIHMSDVPDMSTLHKGRVLFIGDAGHGTLPTQGQGLCQAIEDCNVLHELLVNFPGFAEGDYVDVFALFDEIRLPRVHFVANQSRTVMGHLTASSNIQMKVDRFVFRLILGVRNGLSLNDAIFGYNCDKDVSKALEKYRKRRQAGKGGASAAA
ncbi:FAD/NAD(P)-binding domain-containing protein [Gonapodya prolifera JEL478]|uniref:FAD/NAD(P)-binding domain-containing protein n=1 Tax=Gonapodya prolifera (strain JEL478) TaxID=1344416 RepID=A0A139A6H6_GONPJ|nr:FAD/NAD(P)-binding domain-containing protein [Gonapodya prolifera JEL478]|eukprot:KXS12407.1 FAD/NAD(P)-binding domain-containing protein [Gonapodya prolifera JEL478]